METNIAIGVFGVIAVILAPMITLGISQWLQDRKDKKQQKMAIFTALIAERNNISSERVVQALNLIDIIFSDDKEVLNFWQEYYEMCNKS